MLSRASKRNFAGRDRARSKAHKQLIDFGQGKAVGHWGGPLVWQLEDVENLVLSWKSIDMPKEYEAELLEEFSTLYGKLPFANIQRSHGVGTLVL